MFIALVCLVQIIDRFVVLSPAIFSLNLTLFLYQLVLILPGEILR